MAMVPGGCGDSFFAGLINANPAPDWCQPDAPKKAAALFGGAAVAQPGWAWRNLFGFHENPPAVTTIPDWFCFIFGTKLNGWGIFWLNCFYIPAKFLDEVQNFLAPISCNKAGLSTIMFRQRLTVLIYKYTGWSFYAAEANDKATINYVCPSIYPHVGLVTEVWSRGYINSDDAKAWFAANGLCPVTIDFTFMAAKYVHSPSMIVDLFRRKCISVRVDAEARLHEAGVTDVQERTELLDCTYRQWDVSTIYRALHQLRPGRVPKALEYDAITAKHDLLALGFDPARIDRMIYLAKHDVSHREVVQAFEHGQVNRSQLQDYMRDDGYTDDAIKDLLPFYDSRKQHVVRQEIGAPSSAELVRAAADGLIDPQTFYAQLNGMGLSSVEQQAAGDEVQLRRTRDIHAAGVAAVRAGLKAGELDAQQAVNLLGGYGLDPTAAGLIVSVWAAEASTARKPATPGQLCEWSTRGWVSVKEYRYRLKRMGFTDVDISRIIDTCGLKAVEKQQRIDAANAAKRVSDERKKKAQDDALRKAQEASKARLDKMKGIQEAKGLDAMGKKLRGGLAEVNREIGRVQTRAKTKNAVINPEDVAAHPPPPEPPPTS